MSDRLRNLVFIPRYIPEMPAVAESLTGRCPRRGESGVHEPT
ncbi:MAG: hypothetical protein V5B40_05900 [Candidatus Accumulibacter meliphilus]|jgi:hypothetical protein